MQSVTHLCMYGKSYPQYYRISQYFYMVFTGDKLRGNARHYQTMQGMICPQVMFLHGI